MRSLSQMLVRDPRYRWPTDALMQHEFFRGVQWDSLEEWAKASTFPLFSTSPPDANPFSIHRRLHHDHSAPRERPHAL